MKRKPKPFHRFRRYLKSHDALYIEPPLPGFLDLPPIVQNIPGLGSGRQARLPRPPGKEPAND